VDLLLLVEVQRHPLVRHDLLDDPDTAWRAWVELTRDSFSRSSFEIRVR
jgi:hypothetical protein